MNLESIFKDILAGDPDALNTPEFESLNFNNIKAALEWLATSNEMSDVLKNNLLTEGWRLNFRNRPPTPEEFLTEKYIGEQANTMYAPVSKAFKEFMDPLAPYRTGVLSLHIGWGKDQPLDAKVYIDKDNYKLMGDINPGDLVLSPDGTQTKVLGTTDWPEKDVYEIELACGKTMRCGLHHLHHVSYRKDENGEQIWEDVETIFMIEHPEFSFELQVFDLFHISQLINKMAGKDSNGELIQTSILKSIKKVSFEETRCITVENPNGLYITDNGIVTHNSLMTTLVNIFLSIHFSLMWHPYKFFGQAQTLDSHVQLPDGSYRLFKDVHIGDVIKSPSSTTTVITEIKDWDDDDIYEFEMEDGTTVKSGANHLWPVSYRHNNDGTLIWEVVTTRFIVENITNDIFLKVASHKTLKIVSIKYLGKQKSRCITVDNPDGLYVTDNNIVTHNSPATTYTQCFCAWNMKKGSELLLEPLIQIIEQSPYFERTRSAGDMQDAARAYESGEIDKMYWTTATRSSALMMQNGVNYKLISSAGGLLGQSQPLNAHIYLPDGSYTTMGQIKVGDIIASPTENKQTVLAVWPQGVKECYRVTLEDGRTVECSPDHLWKISYERDANNKRIWCKKPLQFIIDNPDLDIEVWDQDCNDDLDYVWEPGKWERIKNENS